MSKIDKASIHDFKNGEKVLEDHLDRNFELIRAANNDNFERITNNNSQLSRHIKSDDHDERYYTKDQINANFAGDGDIVYEVFTVTSVNEEEGVFTYTDKSGASHAGELTNLGHQVFTLQEGAVHNSSRIEAFVDDTLHRSVVSGGLELLDEHTVVLTEPETEGAEITFKYYKQVRITGTHRTMHENDGEDEIKGLINISETEPSKKFAGKIWGKVISSE